jgi:hypothetical protein
LQGQALRKIGSENFGSPLLHEFIGRDCKMLLFRPKLLMRRAGANGAPGERAVQSALSLGRA